METTRPSTLTTNRLHPTAVPPNEATYLASPDAVPAARHFVTDHLSCLTPALANARLDDVRLIVSELVTNAVQHGTEQGDSLRVVIAPTDMVVRVEVHDPERRSPRAKAVSNDLIGGRGLHIVAALALQWGVYARPFGKSVWAEVAR